MRIRFIKQGEEKYWDEYVYQHPAATLCHLYSWGRVIRDTYGHQTYYLVADNNGEALGRKIAGVLPLVHIKSVVFGNTLVSMPFLNYGGLLTDDEGKEKLLVQEAMRLGRELKVEKIELRHIQPIAWANEKSVIGIRETQMPEPSHHKVRMLLELPQSSIRLFESFKSKLRSQIRKPQKEGLISIIGGKELLGDFYHVFSINMRDLGSPVHSKKLFENIFKVFGDRVKFGLVKYQASPIAAGLVFCFRDTVEIIWASSLRQHNHRSPNMLLYWSLLQHVTDAGYKYFDFGRSTPDEGTYKFKEQWGSTPITLHWYNISSDGKPLDDVQYREIGQLRRRGEFIWQKMPLGLANLFGPMIRGSISL